MVMLEQSEIVNRIEFAKHVANSRGELPTGSINSRSLSERVSIVGGVAVIPLQGVIWPSANFFTRYYGDTACSELATAVQNAAGDTRIKSIYLQADTPGGSVLMLEETAQIIQGLRDRKPLETVVQGLLASAGYYLGSATSKIHASPSSSVGSLGTIYHHSDYSEYFADFGVKVTPITYGKHKADGSPYKPLDAQGRKTLQDWVNSFGEQFMDAVARQRGVSRETVLQKFGQGKVFIAAQALELGLIDSVATLDRLIGANQTPESESETSSAVAPAQTVPSQPAGTTQIQVPVGSKPQATTAKPTPGAKEETPMKLKALLYALELIDSQEASEETCSAAIKAFCKARGVDVPTGDGSENEIISLLTSANATTSANVLEAHKREQGEARQMTADQLLSMRSEVIDAAALINAGRPDPVISLDAINQAADAYVKGDKDLAAIQADWKKALAEDPDSKPAAVRVTGHGSDTFVADATSMLLCKAGYGTAEDKKKDVSQIRGLGLLEIADTFASLHGRPLSGTSREEKALAALSSPGVTTIGSMFASGGASYNRPGDFSGFMSNLAGKVLDQAIPLARVTYDRWTARIMDVPDFKPKTILGAGSFDELDRIMDDEKVKQLQFSEELKGWIQADRYSNKVGLTPVMVKDDDIDGFVQQLMSLMFAHDNTLNQLCLQLLTANVVLPDGLPIFDPGHGNLVNPGGQPSKDQARFMRIAHRNQRGIGTTKRINSRPELVLVGNENEDFAKQTYYSMERLNETKSPEVDGEINVHRGSVREVIVEPDLDDYSKTQWYTFDDPRRFRVIAHCFQTDYGRGGRRTSWFDNETETRWVKLEGRFGAAAAGHRGSCRNGS